MSFWQKIERPIIALSPMDGVTDAPFRFITAKHGRPDIHFTEFTNVEGLARNAAIMLDDFVYSEIERPVVAQIYGSEPESFYKIAIVVCELGFDGVDINMGCPAKKVASRGCGAGLIRNPPLAKEIMRAVKRGIADWSNGKSVEDLGLKVRMIKKIREMNLIRTGQETVPRCKDIPMSVKTRIGYDSVVIEDWVKHLLEEEPVTISIHGRTLKQMYSGQADWAAIARAAELIRPTGTLTLGNGDLGSPEAIVRQVKQSGVDGVLLGRGVFGNPWIFSQCAAIKACLKEGRDWQYSDEEVPADRRFQVLLEHARYFELVKGPRRFSAMRKHFGWYCKGMPQAAQLRNRMCQTSSSAEVESIVKQYQKEWALPLDR